MLENFRCGHTLEDLGVQLAEKVTYVSNCVRHTQNHYPKLPFWNYSLTHFTMFPPTPWGLDQQCGIIFPQSQIQPTCCSPCLQCCLSHKAQAVKLAGEAWARPEGKWKGRMRSVNNMFLTGKQGDISLWRQDLPCDANLVEYLQCHTSGCRFHLF